jgi:hypothetical protein
MPRTRRSIFRLPGLLAGLASALVTLIGMTEDLAGAPRALVVDYEMNPPVVLARLLEHLGAAGFSPLYRPDYPQMTRDDLRESGLIVILSGNGPGYPGATMSARALGPLGDFVRRGGLLVLGPTSGGKEDEGGDHERYLFNLLLHQLDVPIRIGDDWITDEENAYPAPLYRAPFVAPIPGHPVTQGLPARIIADRSPSLTVGQGVTPLVRSFVTAFPRGDPTRKESFPLAALGRAGKGILVVASRHVLTSGGGNGKEPAAPLRPLPIEEDGLREFLGKLFSHLFAASLIPPGEKVTPAGSPLPAPDAPRFALQEEFLPASPPPDITWVHGWTTPAADPVADISPSHAWLCREGIRSGWAHVDKAAEELARLADGMVGSGMNVLWGVAFPQLLRSPRGNAESRDRLMASWERLARDLSASPVRWLMGMEYPGRYADEESMSRAVGVEGREWAIPSPCDAELWEREVVQPAILAAQWARARPAVGGLVLDLEMYGRKPLFFGQGVDFGDTPFQAFLDRTGEASSLDQRALQPKERFPWLRDRGLLREYYRFLEGRAEAMGGRLKEAVQSVRPDLVLGCYSAGILHRWFYRGLLRGMSAPGRPILLFTFQRDAAIDLADLRASGIHAVHVRGLLMGLMRRDDYSPLFRDALAHHAGYWLNRLTSLVAKDGFFPIEAPGDMSPAEAWEVIRHANQQVVVSPPRR